MKKILSFIAIALTAAVFSGCSTVYISNPTNSSKVVGMWTSRTLGELKFYNSSIEEVSSAARKALREKNCKVVYETDGPARMSHNEIVARGDLDVKISVDVYARTERLPKGSTKQPQKYIEVEIVYGSFGDLPHSQDIAERMLKYLPAE